MLLYLYTTFKTIESQGEGNFTHKAKESCHGESSRIRLRMLSRAFAYIPLDMGAVFLSNLIGVKMLSTEEQPSSSLF